MAQLKQIKPPAMPIGGGVKPLPAPGTGGPGQMMSATGIQPPPMSVGQPPQSIGTVSTGGGLPPSPVAPVGTGGALPPSPAATQPQGYTPQTFTPPQITPPGSPGYVGYSGTGAPGAMPALQQGPDYTSRRGGSGYRPQGISAQSVGGAQASAKGDYSQFAEAIMQEQQRWLDPRFESEEAAFRQRMVNQGIQEGTDAYDDAWMNHSRTKNDAYSSARNQAMDRSLFAQNQDFSQSLANANLRQQAGMADAANDLQA